MLRDGSEAERMASILTEAAADITAALSGAVAYPLTITRVTTSGGFDPTVTTTDYACQGWRDEWTQDELANTLIRATDIKFVVLAATLPIVPSTSDRVVVDGTTHVIVAAMLDPAGATFTVQARA